MLKIKDAWCVVTGGASGIGAATARLLVDKGARVIIADKNRAQADAYAEQLCEYRPDCALAYGIDVTDEPAMIAFAQWAEAHVQRIDVLINNAGILRFGSPLTTSLNEWDELYRINLRSAVHATQLFVPQMIERNSGAVVQIASASGKVGLAPLAAYSSLKFALIGYSQSLRASLDGTGVHVGCVTPGLVRTSILDSACLSEDARTTMQASLHKHGVEPARVASAVLRTIEHDLALVDVGADAHLVSLIARFLPSSASTHLARIARRY